MLQTIISSESYIILAVVTLLALVALIYLLSPPMNLLEDISARGAQIRERMRGLLVGQYPSDSKTRLLAAYVDVALEHHEAIWRLREFNLNGSALALVRSGFFDAMVRGWWINKVATNEQIERASRDEVKAFPRMVQMLDQVKQAYSGALASSDAELADLVDRFFYWFKPLWKVLCSYTHSGGRQLARRFTGDQVKPSYTEFEITQALNLSTMALLLLMLMFFASMSRHDEAFETRTLLIDYVAEFNQRLNKS